MNKKDRESGQALGEYALIIAGIALATTVVLMSLGGNISNTLAGLSSHFGSSGATPGTPLGSQPTEIAGQFIDLMQQYYDEHGRWPRSWGDYRYADLGLDPQVWGQPINGLEYNPSGDHFGIANAIGDNYQVYVTDSKGNERHLYDGYVVWYNFADRTWYYHSIQDNIPVDISTLRVVETP